MANPYQGQRPYDTAWQEGYDYGLQNPGDISPQTPDFMSWELDDETAGYIGTIWQEGALAGREESGGGGAQEGEGELITLPEDVRDEMVRFADLYPETMALAEAGDAESYLRDVVGLEDIPPEDDEINA